MILCNIALRKQSTSLPTESTSDRQVEQLIIWSITTAATAVTLRYLRYFIMIIS